MESVAYLNVVDEDGRRLGIGEPAFVAKLFYDVGCANREILVSQAVTFCHENAVGLIKDALRSVWMHIPTVIAPACRLIPKSQLDDIVKAVPSSEGRLGRQRPAVRECTLRFFMEAMGKDALIHQAVEEACRTAAIVLRGKVLVR